MRKLIFILPLLFALACAQPQVDVGRIVGMDYDAGYTTYSSMCTSYNASGVCMGSMIVPVYWPPNYSLQVEGPNKKGKIVREWRDVGPVMYGRASVGLCWVRGSVQQTGCER